VMTGLKQFERDEIERILNSCSTCGKCFEVCPMTAYAQLLSGEAAPKPDSKEVVLSVLDVLRGGAGSPEALAWLAVCTRSGECVPACPKAVDPKMMMRLGRMTASGGLGGPKQLPLRDDPDYFARVRAFAAMQLDEDEQKEWM
jgi:ferredoxin